MSSTGYPDCGLSEVRCLSTSLGALEAHGLWQSATNVVSLHGDCDRRYDKITPLSSSNKGKMAKGTAVEDTRRSNGGAKTKAEEAAGSLCSTASISPSQVATEKPVQELVNATKWFHLKQKTILPSFSKLTTFNIYVNPALFSIYIVRFSRKEKCWSWQTCPVISEHLKGWRLHSLSEKPVPVFDNHHSQMISSNHFKTNFQRFTLCPLPLVLLVATSDKNLALLSLFPWWRCICVSHLVQRHPLIFNNEHMSESL